MSALRIFHPTTTKLLFARDRLLQRSLREGPLPFGVAAEYPLVLAADAARWSYCLGDEAAGEVTAHANLWPRTLAGRKIGLVGNVATDERSRGQGLMRTLLTELKGEAERLGLEALVLWSDLLEFYQKQGFESFGRELRYQFAADVKGARPPEAAYVPLPDDTAAQVAAELLTLRQPVGQTLERTPAEFQQLLTIPALTVLGAVGDRGKLEGFALLGKGADMVGVIHEWGAPSPDHLIEAVRAAAELTGYADILLLAPGDLPADWQEALAAKAQGVTEHAVGLAWTRTPAAKAALASSFIWGLDSI